MHQIMRHALALLGLILVAPSLNAAQSERRIALVIGNAAYQQGALPTSANDAGLIAQTLQAAGFDVVGARDLDGDTLRHTLRERLVSIMLQTFIGCTRASQYFRNGHHSTPQIQQTIVV